MKFDKFKSLLSHIRCTPLHPQWFVYRKCESYNKNIACVLKGVVLDVGCSDQYIKKYLPDHLYYVGLDYYETATEWYYTSPNVFGDAQNLPFADESIDSVLLLDVLEHLPDPESCIKEISRVMRNGGVFVLQVPFLYPLHDLPLDFHRWTHHGLQKLVGKHGFVVLEEIALGTTLETCGLLINIGLCKSLLLWLKSRNPAILLGLIIVPMVPIINILCWLLASVCPADLFMPHGYRLLLRKKKCDISS